MDWTFPWQVKSCKIISYDLVIVIVVLVKIVISVLSGKEIVDFNWSMGSLCNYVASVVDLCGNWGRIFGVLTKELGFGWLILWLNYDYCVEWKRNCLFKLRCWEFAWVIILWYYWGVDILIWLLEARNKKVHRLQLQNLKKNIIGRGLWALQLKRDILSHW